MPGCRVGNLQSLRDKGARSIPMKEINFITQNCGKVAELRVTAKQFDLKINHIDASYPEPVSYTHLRAHETDSYLVCRLLLEKKKIKKITNKKKKQKQNTTQQHTHHNTIQ